MAQTVHAPSKAFTAATHRLKHPSASISSSDNNSTFTRSCSTRRQKISWSTKHCAIQCSKMSYVSRSNWCTWGASFKRSVQVVSKLLFVSLITRLRNLHTLCLILFCFVFFFLINNFSFFDFVPFVFCCVFGYTIFVNILPTKTVAERR